MQPRRHTKRSEMSTWLVTTPALRATAALIFHGSLLSLERVFRPEYLLTNHQRPVVYETTLPAPTERPQLPLANRRCRYLGFVVVSRVYGLPAAPVSLCLRMRLRAAQDALAADVLLNDRVSLLVPVLVDLSR